MSKMNETKIWLIADTHLGHKKIITLCSRPEDYENKIILGIKKNVNIGDIIIHLGDVCLGDDYLNHTKLLATIPVSVTKILIRGNHDKKSDSWLRDAGWDLVCENIIFNKYGKKILLSHRPVIGDFDLNIHGHFHRIDSYDGIPKRHAEERNCADGRQVLISAEYNNYQPVLLRTVVEKGVGGVYWSKRRGGK